jgi:hypothetical protein
MLSNERSGLDDFHRSRVTEHLNMAWIWRVFVSMRVERDIMQTRREELRQVGGHNRELTPFCTVRFTRYSCCVLVQPVDGQEMRWGTYKRHRRGESYDRIS